MVMKLHLANLPPGNTEAELTELFAPVGEVNRVKYLEDKTSGQSLGRALVWLTTEETITSVLQRYNGLLLEDRRLAVSPVKPAENRSKLTEEQEQIASKIIEALGETEAIPCRQILEIVRLCSPKFAETVLEDALAVEEQGGMLVADGSRRRTLGGVFFYLARGRMSLSLKHIIFVQMQQPKEKKQKKQAEEQSANKPASSKKAKPSQKKAAKPSDAARSAARNHTPVSHASPPTPKKVEPEIILTGEELEAMQQKLADLRQAHADAQSRLETLQAQPSNKQVGTFTAIKQVLDLKRQIDEILKQYPQLS